MHIQLGKLDLVFPSGAPGSPSIFLGEQNGELYGGVLLHRDQLGTVHKDGGSIFREEFITHRQGEVITGGVLEGQVVAVFLAALGGGTNQLLGNSTFHNDGCLVVGGHIGIFCLQSGIVAQQIISINQDRLRYPIYNDVREALARTKDFFYCIIQPEPTCLGESIPISASGSLTDDKERV